MPRRRPIALAGLAVSAALAAATAAPAAPAALHLTGTSETPRYGRVTVTFTTDPGLLKLTLSPQLVKTAAGKDFSIECRTDGTWSRIATFHLLGNRSRRVSAPSAVPEQADRCRVRRNSTIVSTMRMRRHD